MNACVIGTFALLQVNTLADGQQTFCEFVNLVHMG